jgi:hypothetical protein
MGRIIFLSNNSPVLLKFAHMKPGKRRLVAKGDRLNWTPIKELKPVKLSALLIEGHVLTVTELQSRHLQAPKVFLVP